MCLEICRDMIIKIFVFPTSALPARFIFSRGDGALELVLFLFISRLLIKINLKILFKMPSTWLAGWHSLRFLFICFSNLYFSFHIHFSTFWVRCSSCDLFMSFTIVLCVIVSWSIRLFIFQYPNDLFSWWKTMCLFCLIYGSLWDIIFLMPLYLSCSNSTKLIFGRKYSITINPLFCVWIMKNYCNNYEFPQYFSSL